MGYAISWVAIRDKPREDILAWLELEATGEFEDVPDSDYLGLQLPNGWYLVWSNRNDLFEGRLIGPEAVAFTVEEHVMTSAARGSRNGNTVWTLYHFAEQGVDHLDADGDLPRAFSTIRDEYCAKQSVADQRNEDVDYIFSIPVKLAKSVTGFEYDMLVPPGFTDGDLPFEVLVSTDPDKDKSSPASSCISALGCAALVLGIPAALVAFAGYQIIKNL